MSSTTSLVRATMADRSRLRTLLVDNFYPYPPLYIPGEETHEEEIDYFLSRISQGRTLMALDGDDLVGMAINTDVDSTEYEVRAQLLQDDCTCEASRVFSEFWAYAEKMGGFWVEGEPSKALDLEVLCVSVRVRGRGIGRALIEGSRQMARQDGYPLFRMDCLTYRAARLAEMVGMTCVYTLPYADYKNEKGETVFTVKEPENALKVYKQRL